MVDFDSLKPDPVETAPTPAQAVPFDSLVDDSEKYGTGTEIAKTAIEQGLSGATLGASKVLETHGIPALGIPAITTPEAIRGREQTNPITSTVSNIGGTAGLIALTGGTAAPEVAASLAAKVGAGAIEGGVIGGVNQITDDWSQNKALDAQKIVAAAGLGSLLGAGGAGVVEGIRAKFSPIGKIAPALEKDAVTAAESVDAAASAPVDAPKVESTGVMPTSYDQIVDRVSKARADGTAVPLPAQGELQDAISRVGMENPVNPAQMESLSSQKSRDVYQTAKESQGDRGVNLTNYEALQKSELVGKADQAIQDVAPGFKPTQDAYAGGRHAIDAFTEQYQSEKEALKPFFKELKATPVSGDLLPAAIVKITDAVPGVANMFDASGAELAIKPYKTSWGIDRATYNAVKEAVDSLSSDSNTLESLWNVRKGLDQHIDVLARGQAPAEIRSIKAALLDQMQEASGNPDIRDVFRRYAINEQQREVIEKAFGASVGSPEFGQISKVKPEVIGDRIFGNTASVEAAKNILPSEKFNQILSNWLSEARSAATDKGAFSSNKFGSFLRRNQDALKIAFGDQPEKLQRMKDLVTIMRILPDSASVNPSGTAKTLFRMVTDAKLHDITWEGLLASIPQKAFAKIRDRIELNELNQVLSGKSLKASQTVGIRDQVARISDKIERGVGGIFSSAASQTRKAK